jgi:hypothetical protein
MDDQPYMHGFVYSDGLLALGAPCVAPVLEVTNCLREPITVFWVNRTVFDDDAAGALFATANRAVLLPGELALATNLYASLGAQRSVLMVASETGGFNMFTLHFAEEKGYFLLPVPRHWQTSAQTTGAALVTSTDVDLPRIVLLQSPPYLPRFQDTARPKWRHCVIFPIDAKLLVPQPLGARA